jgi:hypothetical protein
MKEIILIINDLIERLKPSGSEFIQQVINSMRDVNTIIKARAPYKII